MKTWSLKTTMSSNIFFYDQAPNRSIPKRCRKYSIGQVSHSSGKVSASAPATTGDDNKADVTDGLGKKSLMPEITLAYHSVRNYLDSTLTNDEDSQRHLFEQTKASAPETLYRLSLYLYELHNKSGSIPKSLEYQLLCGYEEFTRDVIMVPREWQTAALREQVRISRKKSDAHAHAHTHAQNTPSSVETGEQRKKTDLPINNNSSQNHTSMENLQKGRKRVPSSLTTETVEEEGRNLPVPPKLKDKDRLTPKSSGKLFCILNRSLKGTSPKQIDMNIFP